MSGVLSVQGLAGSGGFVSGEPVEKAIRWQQGEEEHDAIVYVRHLSYQTAVADITSGSTEAIAVRIANTICDAEGAPIFKPEDITGTEERGPLHGNIVVALLQAIGEVNSPPKALAPLTNSGAS